MNYADDLYEKSCKVADVNEEFNLNAILGERGYPSIYHSLRKYCATHPKACLTDIVFMAQLLLKIQNGGIQTGKKQQ